MDRSCLKELQVSQQQHDHANHFEILCLHKADRLKHYGLHYAKYVGRLARNSADFSELSRTVTDAFLICLSSANAINQDLSKSLPSDFERCNSADVLTLADAVGRFADACEKIDHLEEFRTIAVSANLDIAKWITSAACANNIDLPTLVRARREVLSHRQAYQY